MNACTLAALGTAGWLPATQAAEQLPEREATDTVVVEGALIREYRPATSSIGKLTESIRDTPQTITTVMQQEMTDRGISTLNDALRSVPGITLGAGETSWQGTNVFLRGFTARNDMFLDGIRDFGYYYRDPFNSARVEVLKGPESILFGRGSTGGVIQQVSKPVVLDSHIGGELQLGSADMQRLTFDVGGTTPRLGENSGVRLTAMAHDSGVAARDGAKNQRWGIASSLALGLGTPTRVHVNYFHQDDDLRPDYGLPWLQGRPAPVNRRNFYGFDTDHLDTTVDIATLRIEHDFDARFALKSQTRYSRAKRDFRITEALVPAGTPSGTPLADITLTRNEFEGYSTDSLLQNQTDLTSRFATGAIEHTLVSGIELSRENPRPVYVSNTGVPTTNLVDPPPQQYSVALSYPRLAARTVVESVGVYALDTIKFDDRWHLLLGARWDRVDTEYRSTSYAPSGDVIGRTAVDRTDHMPSYRAALVFKPVAAGTLYVGYGTSFDPSAAGIESMISSGRALGQANQRLAPEKNRTYELGAKWELSSQALLSSSIFRIEKTNARVPDPAVPGFNTLGGAQRVDGIEIELAGRVMPFWNLRGGYAYLDSETVRTTPGGPLLGAPLPMTPKHTASLWNAFDLPGGWELAVGALHVSSRLGQNTAASYLVAPGYTLFDAMVRYRVGEHIGLQLNVNNITNEHYFDQLHPFHVIPGPGRTVLASLQVNY